MVWWSHEHIEACVTDIKTWKTQNFLMLSRIKTEVTIVVPRELRDNISHSHISLNNTFILD